MNLLNNQRGISLLGVLVASAAVVVLTASLSTMMSNSQRYVLSFQNRNSILILQQRVSSLLSNTTQCTQNFLNFNASGNITTIRQFPDSGPNIRTILAEGQSPNSAPEHVVNTDGIDLLLTFPPTTAEINNPTPAELRVTLTDASGNAVGGDQRVITVPLNVFLGDVGGVPTVTGCSATSAGVTIADICPALNGRVIDPPGPMTEQCVFEYLTSGDPSLDADNPLPWHPLMSNNPGMLAAQGGVWAGNGDVVLYRSKSLSGEVLPDGSGTSEDALWGFRHSTGGALNVGHHHTTLGSATAMTYLQFSQVPQNRIDTAGADPPPIFGGSHGQIRMPYGLTVDPASDPTKSSYVDFIVNGRIRNLGRHEMGLWIPSTAPPDAAFRVYATGVDNNILLTAQSQAGVNVETRGGGSILLDSGDRLTLHGGEVRVGKNSTNRVSAFTVFSNVTTIGASSRIEFGSNSGEYWFYQQNDPSHVGNVLAITDSQGIWGKAKFVSLPMRCPAGIDSWVHKVPDAPGTCVGGSCGAQSNAMSVRYCCEPLDASDPTSPKFVKRTVYSNGPLPSC